MSVIAYNEVALPSFMYGTAWKKEATAPLVLQAVQAGFRALDTANQLIHYEEARVGEALVTGSDPVATLESFLVSDNAVAS